MYVVHTSTVTHVPFSTFVHLFDICIIFMYCCIPHSLIVVNNKDNSHIMHLPVVVISYPFSLKNL